MVLDTSERDGELTADGANPLIGPGTIFTETRGFTETEKGKYLAVMVYTATIATVFGTCFHGNASL
jgi:hypothetical protein